MSTLDIVLVVIAALCVIIGLSKGVLKQLFSFGALILAFVASYFLCAPVYEFGMTGNIGSIQPYTAIEEKVNELAVEKLGEGINEVITQETIEEQISNALADMGLPELLVGPVYDALAKDVESIQGKSIGDLFIPMLSSFVLKILCYAVIFVVAFILLKIIFGLISKLLDVSVFKFFDRLLGGVAGLVIALIIANVVMLGLSFLAGVVPSISEFVVADLESSMGIAEYFYNSNWISYLLAHNFDFESLVGEITANLSELQ